MATKTLLNESLETYLLSKNFEPPKISYGSRKNYRCGKSSEISYDFEKPVITKVKNFPNHIKPRRGGVILYTNINGTCYFIFALDFRNYEISDFAGSLNYHEDENAIIGCLREFHEEAQNVFDDFEITLENVQEHTVIYNSNAIDIFVPISFGDMFYQNSFEDLEKLRVKFRDKVRMKNSVLMERIARYGNEDKHRDFEFYCENYDIVWFSTKELLIKLNKNETNVYDFKKNSEGKIDLEVLYQLSDERTYPRFFHKVKKFLKDEVRELVTKYL